MAAATAKDVVVLLDGLFARDTISYPDYDEVD